MDDANEEDEEDDAAAENDDDSEVLAAAADGDDDSALLWSEDTLARVILRALRSSLTSDRRPASSCTAAEGMSLFTAERYASIDRFVTTLQQSMVMKQSAK